MRLVAAALLVLAVSACHSGGTTAAPRRAGPDLLVMSGPGGTIFTVYADGTHKSVLPSHGRTPSWTPDGRIIYVSASPAQVWVMNSDGSNAHQVGSLHLGGGNPIVKPQMADNGLIAFSDVQGRPSRTADNLVHRTARG